MVVFWLDAHPVAAIPGNFAKDLCYFILVLLFRNFLKHFEKMEV